MTLAQLRYVITVAQLGTLSSAAKRLYISQPSLTSAIKELEKELGITIFIRTNKGVVLSRQGEEFLGYARQVIEQTNLIEEKYLQDNYNSISSYNFNGDLWKLHFYGNRNK